ncbi:1-acyl-sn-glycerol-3-phosphate acyltransferase [Sphingomonas lacunae]|uniref:1-acyl-sn-glycerol-3-phosphate acyltransferase n=1 Tax=Sphingomonas lacunae TaxID=2698828 RepID=A0A6M4AVK6_9SPHN|nr:lysophospholipid acyltransferase family protein [Sphingomonas lacunae]QJQ32736.1 1-acyl-sn-glycerol-3-phosphate acyltransferase [Sphingomonas lacunae]
MTIAWSCMALPLTGRIDAKSSQGRVMSVASWLRIVARLSALVGLLVLLVPLHYLTHAIGRHSHWPRTFLGSAAAVVGAKVVTVGAPRFGNVFFVANHLSWIDILALGGASGTAFIAKAELAKTPVIGWLCGLNRTLYVSRDDRLGVSSQISMVREAMAENHAIAVFPEGTTNDGRSLLPFKSSLLGVLEPPPADVHVQPVFIDYGDVSSEIAWIGNEGGIDNALRILGRSGRFDLHIHFLESFDPTLLGGRKAIAAECRARIEAVMQSELYQRSVA